MDTVNQGQARILQMLCLALGLSLHFFSAKSVWLLVIILLFALFCTLMKFPLRANKFALLFSLLLTSTFLSSLLLSTHLYPVLIMELGSLITMMFFLVIHGSAINSYISYDYYTTNAAKTIFYMSLIISAIGLLKMFFLSMGLTVQVFASSLYFTKGTSLRSDYNLFATQNICGLLSLVWLLQNKKEIYLKSLTPLWFTIIAGSVIFSGSRRGIVLLLIIMGVIVFRMLVKMIRRHGIAFYARLCTAILALAILFVIGYEYSYFVKHSDDALSSIFHRYSLIFDVSRFFSDRLERWFFALHELNNRSLATLIFGGGFDYIRQYALAFGYEQGDYPHNFVLSSALGGGILSLITLFLFITLMFRKILQYMNSLWLDGLIILLFLILACTSGNTILTFNIILLLSIHVFSANKYAILTTQQYKGALLSE